MDSDQSSQNAQPAYIEVPTMDISNKSSTSTADTNRRGDEDTELNIARRTRSHLRIEDFVPNDNLDFPDVDMNLYQNTDSEVDTEYKKFLTETYSDKINTDTTNDDNDPPYVYNDDIFSHGWKFNLFEANEFHQDESEDQATTSDGPIDEVPQDGQFHMISARPSTVSGTSSVSPSKMSRRKIDMFDDPEFARILNQQLRQHIQLLSQTYLLTRNTTTMRKEAEEAKGHLHSYMKIFKHKSKPSNLLPSIRLIDSLESPKDPKSSIRLSWRHLPIPDCVRKQIHNNPKIFMYPNLLPKVAYSILPERLMPKKSKINFTLNEDKLLAYALNEFKGESSPYAYIASLLMTAKTKTQISNHIKNIKRSPGNENNPIKLYYASGQLPEINLDSDMTLSCDDSTQAIMYKIEPDETESQIKEETVKKEEVEGEGPSEEVEISEEQNQQTIFNQDGAENRPNDDQCQDKVAVSEVEHQTEEVFQGHDDLMNMDLEDLMAASTTISRSNTNNNANNSNSENTKIIRNQRLKKSMLNLMSHNFSLSNDMGDLIVQEFLKSAQQNLTEKQYIHFLQLLGDLMKRSSGKEADEHVIIIFQEIYHFLTKINAPQELVEKLVLFLNQNQASRCGHGVAYLHWMRFFKFMREVELNHEGDDAFEKKLVRLIDAIQKDDPNKVRLAVTNLIGKHPYLNREYEALCLSNKPHESLFACEEDFDDITEPISEFDEAGDRESLVTHEHFSSKVTMNELSYASQTCPCRCHSKNSETGQSTQHCGDCNLKFMKGRMYLVHKIKPVLAEWSYTGRTESPTKTTTTTLQTNSADNQRSDWTLEEDKEILEFCRAKAEQNDDTISFDAATFEELVSKGRQSSVSDPKCKKSAREIAERFNQLMEMYRDENSNGVL